MLTPLVAHVGRPSAAHDLWTSWSADPLVLLGLFVAVALYVRGRRRRRGRARARSDWCFGLGLLAIAIALESPLDALAAALASAHMVQHVLLIVVAAPLLAWSAPSTTMARGAPPRLARATAGLRRRLGLTPARVRILSGPLTVSALHAAVLWLWHSAALYDAAVRHHLLHVVEHAGLFVTALLFWNVVVTTSGRHAPGYGERILLVFAIAMQSVFLAVLLTFADSPWYDSYRSTAPAWGLEPLADQQLAGVIMWVPAGLVYVATALILLAAWLAETESGERLAQQVERATSGS